ncbi:hypothetical protein HYV85_05445 [Candidatus Woesearchaeota archaeon]|nr:hypothetical protein [Candidatus Woesearchaeota archaeon]
MAATENFKRCMQCKRYNVKNPNHDLCYDCWRDKEDADYTGPIENHFEDNLDFNEIPTVYVMFYGKDGKKIGYTEDLSSRLIEIKRAYPDNRLVYFREFVVETDARRFEYWLKGLSSREINKFVSGFQDKLKKVEQM